MPGTRTAPTVNGTPANRRVSLHFIDSVGKTRSFPQIFPIARGTNANIEALAGATSDISNASLYAIGVQDWYLGIADAANALDETVQSVADHLLFSAFDPTDPADTRAIYLPAPEASIFNIGTRVIDPANVDIVALLGAALACLPAGYGITGATFNQNSQRNTKQKF